MPHPIQLQGKQGTGIQGPGDTGNRVPGVTGNPGKTVRLGGYRGSRENRGFKRETEMTEDTQTQEITKRLREYRGQGLTGFIGDKQGIRKNWKIEGIREYERR